MNKLSEEVSVDDEPEGRQVLGLTLPIEHAAELAACLQRCLDTAGVTCVELTVYRSAGGVISLSTTALGKKEFIH